jgi:glycerol-3-phosphate dehydrogenase
MAVVSLPESCDLLVVGGGINGLGIARDAAGRGLRVVVCEQGDLAGGTTWASSKLIHGGLRYLEHGEFRLVREALAEREILLRIAPHLVRPMRFVIPHAQGMRPVWMIRAGLWLYDHLATRDRLPRSASGPLPTDLGLAAAYLHGFEYSDCVVDDARLAIANALAAAEAGAHVCVRTRCTGARPDLDQAWRAQLELPGAHAELRARAIVNAAGPWARQFLVEQLGIASQARLRLVQGSHIVVRRPPPDKALLLQNDDGRVIFVLPFEHAFTLIGTTDTDVAEPAQTPRPTEHEIAYLLRAVNRMLAQPILSKDIVWSYAGMRPLYDDGSRRASAVTRDYVLQLDVPKGMPCLSVFGGKLTTYRRLAEQALTRLRPWFPRMGSDWTAARALPGGDFGPAGVAAYAQEVAAEFAQLPRDWVEALVARHGTRTRDLLHGVRGCEDLGQHFGAGLTAREVDHFVEREWARSPDDVLWRRTKCGLHLSAAQRDAVANYMQR